MSRDVSTVVSGAHLLYASSPLQQQRDLCCEGKSRGRTHCMCKALRNIYSCFGFPCHELHNVGKRASCKLTMQQPARTSTYTTNKMRTRYIYVYNICIRKAYSIRIIVLVESPRGRTIEGPLDPPRSFHGGGRSASLRGAFRSSSSNGSPSQLLPPTPSTGSGNTHLPVSGVPRCLPEEIT